MPNVQLRLTNQFHAALTFAGETSGPASSIALTLREVLKGDKGDKGETGDPGPVGPAGQPGQFSDLPPLSYDHVQGVPAIEWVIVHRLGRAPVTVTVCTSAGDIVEGDIAFPDGDTAVVSFSGEFAGIAHVV
jgi:hypothetical protein